LQYEVFERKKISIRLSVSFLMRVPCTWYWTSLDWDLSPYD